MRHVPPSKSLAGVKEVTFPESISKVIQRDWRFTGAANLRNTLSRLLLIVSARPEVQMFFSACAVISAFSRRIVAWILHLHACFTPTGVRKPWFDMVWLMMHDVIHCNPGSIWCCWNRVGFCGNLLLIRQEHYWNICCKLQIWHPPTGSAPLESFKSDRICKLYPALPSRLWPHSPPFHIQIWPSHLQCCSWRVTSFSFQLHFGSHRYLHTISLPILWCPGHTGEGHIYIGWHKRQFSTDWRSGAQKPCWPDQNWVLWPHKCCDLISGTSQRRNS